MIKLLENILALFVELIIINIAAESKSQIFYNPNNFLLNYILRFFKCNIEVSFVVEFTTKLFEVLYPVGSCVFQFSTIHN